MDSWMDILNISKSDKSSTMSKVFLMINSDLWLSKRGDLDKVSYLTEQANNLFYKVTMNSTSHYNFNDSYLLLSPHPLLQRLFSFLRSSSSSSSNRNPLLIPSFLLVEDNPAKKCLFGQSDGVVVHQTVKNLLVQFFDRHLRDQLEQLRVASSNTSTNSSSSIPLVPPLQLRSNQIYNVITRTG